jgi:hypothetical protein
MDLSLEDLLREAAGGGAAGGGAARSDTRATTPEHDDSFSYDFVRTQGTPPAGAADCKACGGAHRAHTCAKRVTPAAQAAAKAAPPAAAARQGVKGTSTKWTSTEDEAMVAWHAEHPNDWAGAGKKLGKTGQQCRKRWMHHLDPGINWGAWSAQEQEAFQNLCREHGKRWVKIASLMPGRTELQCNSSSCTRGVR